MHSLTDTERNSGPPTNIFTESIRDLNDMRPRVLLVSPLSGATSGIEAVGWMVIRSPLAIAWEIATLDTSTARSNSERGVMSWRGTWKMGKLLWRMRTALREFRPDACWIQGASNHGGFLKFGLLASLAFRAGVPVICKYGGDDFAAFYASQVGPVQDLIRSVLRRCAAVLVEAACLMHQFYSLLPSARIRFAYLGLDPGASQLPHRSRPARNVLFVGHVSRAKGAVDLLAAMPTVSKAIPGARLVLLGEHLRRERSVLHVHDRDAGWRAVKARPANVEAPGILTGPAKRQAFAEADVFCLPSASEGFPMSVLEAMAAGVPLVTTTAGAMGEILKEGVNTRFVPFGDPVRLAEVLSDLLSNAGRYARARMAAENRRAVEERFNLETFAEGVREAVGDVGR